MADTIAGLRDTSRAPSEGTQATIKGSATPAASHTAAPQKKSSSQHGQSQQQANGHQVDGSRGASREASSHTIGGAAANKSNSSNNNGDSSNTQTGGKGPLAAEKPNGAGGLHAAIGDGGDEAAVRDDMLEQQFEMLLQKHNGGLGFSITGGRDFELDEGDPSVYITAIVPGGAAERVRCGVRCGVRCAAVEVVVLAVAGVLPSLWTTGCAWFVTESAMHRDRGPD